MHVTESKTNDLIFRLEQRKYGGRLNSMQLAQKADVSLDYVNRVENQLPVEDQTAVEKMADALGVTPNLLRKISGVEEMSATELSQLEQCLVRPRGEGQLRPECRDIGLQPLA